MKKILFVCSLYAPHVGGIETMVHELAQVCRQEGIEPVILTKQWPDSLTFFEYIENVPVYRVKSARTDEEFSEVVATLLKKEAALKSDLIHVIGVRRPLPLVALLLARRWGVPLISTIAGGDIPDPSDKEPGRIWEEGKVLVADALRQSDVVTCVSNALKEQLSETMPDLQDVKMIYAGMDFSVIRNATPEKRDNPFIFSLRRLDPSKGISVLIHAFALLREEFPELRLVIAGEGSEETSLRQQASDLGLTDRVDFIGTVSLSRGMSLLKTAVLTAVPSLSEGGGLINIEAQAAGCPVVASRVGGIPEYLRDGETGLLVEPGDAQALARAMRTLLLDQELRERFIRNGAFFAKRFSWEALGPEYLALYGQVSQSLQSKNTFSPWSPLTENLWKQIAQV